MCCGFGSHRIILPYGEIRLGGRHIYSMRLLGASEVSFLFTTTVSDPIHC